MLMRGDLDKIINQINPILEAYNKRILALEEAQKEPPKAKKDTKAK